MLDLTACRILVPGGSGFVGSALVQKLGEMGCADIFVPRRRDYDLNEEAAVQRLFEESRPDVIFHCAGRVGGVAANLAAPGQFFYDNIRMNIYLVHHAHLCGVKKIVTLVPSCAYPNTPPSFPFKEEDLWEGYPEASSAAYSLAKKMLVVQTNAYAREFGLNAVNLIPANLYGPRDNFDLEQSHVVPALVRKFVEAVEEGRDSVTLWGTGSPSREFLYVEDCAEAVVRAAEQCETPEPINLGSGADHTIRQLAEALAQVTGFQGQLLWDTTRPDGQGRRKFDLNRQEQLLGFHPRTSLVEGLRKTVDWFRANRTTLARL